MDSKEERISTAIKRAANHVREAIDRYILESGQPVVRRRTEMTAPFKTTVSVRGVQFEAEGRQNLLEPTEIEITLLNNSENLLDLLSPVVYDELLEAVYCSLKETI